MNNSVLRKTDGNVRKHRNIELTKTKKRKYLVSQPYYRKFIGYRNEKNSNTFELACFFKFINIRSE